MGATLAVGSEESGDHENRHRLEELSDQEHIEPRGLAIQWSARDLESDLPRTHDAGGYAGAIECDCDQGRGGSLARGEQFRRRVRLGGLTDDLRLDEQTLGRVADRRDHGNDALAFANPSVDFVDRVWKVVHG